MTKKIREKLLLYKVRTDHDTDAFAELYDLYIGPIYRFVYFKISNKEEAEDIVSDVFLKAWDYLTKENLTKEKRNVNSFQGLVYAIARNNIIDAYRERAKKKECVISVGGARIGDVLDESSDIQKEVERNEDFERLVAAVKKMKQEYQDVIHLRHIEGLSIREISEILDKSYTNVRVILHRATKKLKELVNYE